jgi:nucleoside 2-deoxyribosyltransferase
MSKAKDLRCLLLAPDSGDYSPVRDRIFAALTKNRLEPLLSEARDWSALSLYELRKAILRADFIIADLTGHDPNVMYEVGVAHALRKPIFLIVQKSERKVPAVFKGNLYWVYDPERLDQLEAYVEIFIRDFAKARARAISA